MKLEDDSLWEVDAVDRIDTMLWLPTEDVLVCGDGLLIRITAKSNENRWQGFISASSGEPKLFVETRTAGTLRGTGAIPSGAAHGGRTKHQLVDCPSDT